MSVHVLVRDVFSGTRVSNQPVFIVRRDSFPGEQEGERRGICLATTNERPLWIGRKTSFPSQLTFLPRANTEHLFPRRDGRTDCTSNRTVVRFIKVSWALAGTPFNELDSYRTKRGSILRLPSIPSHPPLFIPEIDFFQKSMNGDIL